jgi:acetate---CoA ligase (ADP-forming) subunit alpha
MQITRRPDKTMENPFQRLMNPTSIAYFGGSNSMETLGTAQLLSIIQGGYGGRIYPIHPREKKVLGLRSYPDVRLLPETPDLVIMAISGHRVPGLLDACGRKGIRRAVVVSAGFGEMGAA